MVCQAAFIAEHKKCLPEPDVPLAPGSAHRVLTYDPAADKAVWEGNTVIRHDVRFRIGLLVAKSSILICPFAKPPAYRAGDGRKSNHQ